MKVTSVYVKPLAGEVLRNVSPEKVLRMLERDVLKRMKASILQTTFSQRAKKSLAESLRVTLRPRSLLVEALHPAFMPLVKGQKKRQMTWLVRAKRPIPIVTETGELIFRWATPRSMANGKWIHPGRKPQDFIEKAKEEARTYVRSRMAKELKRQIKAAWVKS